MQVLDEAIKTIQKTERVRVIFDILIEALGLDYSCKLKDISDKMKELHEQEQEATKFVASMTAKSYNADKALKVRKVKGKEQGDESAPVS